MLQLIRDLQQVTDDHLVVGGALRMVIDRLGDHRRLSRRRGCVIGRQRVRGESRTRQSYPQLRAPEPAFFEGLVILLQQLEPFVRDGVQPDVIPGAQLFRRAEAEWLPGTFRFHGERLQHVGHFGHTHAAVERHGAEMVAMQTTGELGKEGVLCVGGDTFDDELLARHAQRERRAFLEQVLGTPGHPRRGGRERGVPLRIHRVLVQRDGQLDKEVGQLSRKGGLLRRRGHGTIKIALAPVLKVTFAKRNAPGVNPGRLTHFAYLLRLLRLLRLGVSTCHPCPRPASAVPSPSPSSRPRRTRS